MRQYKFFANPEGIFYCATFGENGINSYLNDSLAKQGIQIKINATFTLQNGAQILKKEFDSVRRLDYNDSFKITDTNDLLDYLFSLSSVSDADDLDRNDLFFFFEKQKDENGIIHIPKEYGMFIADGLPNKNI